MGFEPCRACRGISSYFSVPIESSKLIYFTLDQTVYQVNNFTLTRPAFGQSGWTNGKPVSGTCSVLNGKRYRVETFRLTKDEKWFLLHIIKWNLGCSITCLRSLFLRGMETSFQHWMGQEAGLSFDSLYSERLATKDTFLTPG